MGPEGLGFEFSMTHHKRPPVLFDVLPVKRTETEKMNRDTVEDLS